MTNISIYSIVFLLLSAVASAGQVATPTPLSQTEKADAILGRALTFVGGNRYLQIRSQIGRGKYSTIKENAVASFQSFVDVIVFPDQERAEFKGPSGRSIQVNTGSTGWTFDADQQLIKDQNEDQIAAFRDGLRVSLDNLLRGYWKADAVLSYAGKRPSTLGKRNDAIRLTYKDGFVVEFEFAIDDGSPQKAVYRRKNADGEDVVEEDRYAQFVDFDGVRAPLIIDRFTAGKQSSRINYESIEFNKPIPGSIFAKPANVKDAKKDLKL